MISRKILSSLKQLEAENMNHAETSVWVAARLRQLIAEGLLSPGVKLPEEILRKALNVSRNTLREAFATLHAERIVTRIPNRGVFVSRPTADDIQEIYRVRRLLEPASLMQAPASSAGILDVTVQKAQKAAADGDVPAMANANQEFHRMVVALAGSVRLNRLMEEILAEMRLVFASMASDARFHAPYAEDNARVVELLKSGCPEKAARLLTNYLCRAEQQLLVAVNEGNQVHARPISIPKR